MSFIIGLLCLFSLLTPSYGRVNSVAFMYRANIPDEAFYLYDWLIVDPNSFSITKFKKEKFYIKKRAKILAYVSVGELEPYRPYFSEVNKGWIMGKNKIWHTYIADLRKASYRDFLINRVFKPLAKSGYEGFFLDTLDSYQMALKSKDWKSYENAEVKFVKRLRKLFPNKIIIVNRPFRIINEIKNDINGFVAEDLFYGLNRKLGYSKLPKKETENLLAKLKDVKRLGIPVTVIDYIPPTKRKLAIRDAKKISALGFIPYVTDKDLSIIGVSTLAPIPRRIMLLYDSRGHTDPGDCDIHNLVQMPLEWFGYAVDIRDLNHPPKGYLADRYRGIVIWPHQTVDNPKKFYQWIEDKINQGVKVFFIGNFGLPNRYIEKLRVKVIKNQASPFERVKLVHKIGNPGFEIKPYPEYSSEVYYPENGTSLLTYKNYKGQVFSALALTKWGGYAMPGGLIREIGNDNFWVYDPFKFFKKLFGYIPALDTTTENGRRLMTIHIDGDAFYGDTVFNPSITTGESIRDNILKKYKLPTTASVIIGEIAPWGLHPKRSKRLMRIARTIFKLPYVEIASHTTSHPFCWKDYYRISLGEKPLNPPDKQTGLYNLPLKNYKWSIKKEVKGSINFINKYLSPKGKRVKVLLWSGDCLPPRKAVKMCYDLHVYNVNGGDTTINNKSPFLENVSPLGLDLNGYFQVYAPIQNEDVYTNLWHDHYGFVNVISTFKLTDKPRRLKPLSMYYHFYSGQYISSLKALKKVYNYALSQEVLPIYLSEYAQRVLEFRGAAICTNNDTIIIRDGGALKTLRLPKRFGYPNINRSKGVVGYREINGETYISLDNSGDYSIVLEKQDKNKLILNDSNGIVKNFKNTNGKISISLASHVPLEFSVRAGKACRINVKSNGRVKEWKHGRLFYFKLVSGKNAEIKAYCPH